MTLTSMAVSKAKPRDKQYKLTDERGLYLLVMPNGGRYRRLRYQFAGKSKSLALGIYPDVSLAKARERRDRARELLADGIDPSAHRKEVAAEAELEATSSFRLVAEEWLMKRKREGLSEVTLAKAKWLLEFVYPTGRIKIPCGLCEQAEGDHAARR